MGFNSLCFNADMTDFVFDGSFTSGLSSSDPDSHFSSDPVVIFSIITDLNSDDFSFVMFTEGELFIDGGHQFGF